MPHKILKVQLLQGHMKLFKTNRSSCISFCVFLGITFFYTIHYPGNSKSPSDNFALFKGYLLSCASAAETDVNPDKKRVKANQAKPDKINTDTGIENRH